MTGWIDAHNHLQDPAFDSGREAMLCELQDAGVVRCVVNGTRVSDWPEVVDVCARWSGAIPSFGIHPWYVSEAGGEWLHKLESLLETHPSAGVGEIGLDRWVHGHDIEAQSVFFRAQLDLARRFDRPATIHCLRAWGRLIEDLDKSPPPPRGVLVHSFGGSREVAEELIRRRAYFSFSGHFLHDHKEAAREVFAALPMDRLLVETDAPQMPLPTKLRPMLFSAATDPAHSNHPANLPAIYAGLAHLRGIPVSDLALEIAANFSRLFNNEG